MQVALRTRANVGDRVDFYICWATDAPVPITDASVAQRAFAQSEVDARALPIDMRWYYEAQLKKPIKRITDLLDITPPFDWSALSSTVDAQRRLHAKKRDRMGFNALFRIRT